MKGFRDLNHASVDRLEDGGANVDCDFHLRGPRSFRKMLPLKGGTVYSQAFLCNDKEGGKKIPFYSVLNSVNFSAVKKFQLIIALRPGVIGCADPLSPL